MKELRVGVVGLGHRGRHMLRLAADGFDFVNPVAACDLIESNWYETKFGQNKPMCESLPETRFYTDFKKMLDEFALDTDKTCPPSSYIAASKERRVLVLGSKKSVASFLP